MTAIIAFFWRFRAFFAALAVTLALWYAVSTVLSTFAALKAAREIIGAQTEQLNAARNREAALVHAVAEQAESAQAYGARLSGIESAAQQTLEALSNAPETRVCLDTPAIRIGIDGVLRTRAAIDSTLPDHSSGGASHPH